MATSYHGFARCTDVSPYETRNAGRRIEKGRLGEWEGGGFVDWNSKEIGRMQASSVNEIAGAEGAYGSERGRLSAATDVFDMAWKFGAYGCVENRGELLRQ